MVVVEGGAVSYEQGTPVGKGEGATPAAASVFVRVVHTGRSTCHAISGGWGLVN